MLKVIIIQQVAFTTYFPTTVLYAAQIGDFGLHTDHLFATFEVFNEAKICQIRQHLHLWTMVSHGSLKGLYAVANLTQDDTKHL